MVRWTRDEDHILIERVELLGTNNWGRVADGFEGARTPASCSRRWRRLGRNDAVPLQPPDEQAPIVPALVPAPAPALAFEPGPVLPIVPAPAPSPAPAPAPAPEPVIGASGPVLPGPEPVLGATESILAPESVLPPILGAQESVLPPILGEPPISVNLPEPFSCDPTIIAGNGGITNVQAARDVLISALDQYICTIVYNDPRCRRL